MFATYRLSNRQATALLVRGTELEIAIPEPLDAPEDALAFARGSLPDIEPELIVEAEWRELPAEVPAKGPGLAGCLGALLTPETADSIWHIVVAVCWCRIRPRGCRHQSTGTQWPGVAFFGDRRFPPSAETVRTENPT